MRCEIWVKVNYNDGTFKSDYLDFRLEGEPSHTTLSSAQARCTELNQEAGVLKYYIRTFPVKDTTPEAIVA